jgi:oligosaccharide repeat unit polymerase
MYFIAKDVSFQGSKDDLVSLRDHFVSYMAGPFAAFDKVVNEPDLVSGEYAYNHSLASFYRYANLLFGADYELPPALDTYCFVPFPTNVYTVLKFYYLDFGQVGLCLVMLFIGFIQTWLFLKAAEGNEICICMSAVLVFPLVMAFFDDHYYNILGYLRVALMLVVYFRLIGRVPGLGALNTKKLPSCARPAVPVLS